LARIGDFALPGSLLARIGFEHTKDVTAHTIREPLDSGAERDFPVFLLTARRENT